MNQTREQLVRANRFAKSGFRLATLRLEKQQAAGTATTQDVVELVELGIPLARTGQALHRAVEPLSSARTAVEGIRTGNGDLIDDAAAALAPYAADLNADGSTRDRLAHLVETLDDVRESDVAAMLGHDDVGALETRIDQINTLDAGAILASTRRAETEPKLGSFTLTA